MSRLITDLKDQECEYLRLKLQETISEYEKVKSGEITARDEVTHLNTEVIVLKLMMELMCCSKLTCTATLLSFAVGKTEARNSFIK